jgi:DNA-binding MarR family transcriptional regulator
VLTGAFVEDDASSIARNIHDVSSIPGTIGGVTAWLSEKEQGAWRQLLEMTGQLRARLNRQLQDSSGLSMADYDVLVQLSEAADHRRRVFELSHALQWEQSRLSHHLARMQQRGLLSREDCEEDRRGALVVLTDAGRKAIELAAPAHVDTVRRLVFDDLTAAQIKTLTAVTSSVLQRLAADESSQT